MNYAELLLEWFDNNKRDMPWRRTSNPYAIWVSEVMLQQTQVDTVIPYYLRFMERFPTSHDLAIASLEEVHLFWQGLGYYRRADNLQKGAKLIDEKWNGVFPRDPKLVSEIPGIGPYTLGAICSIAFYEPLPAVDGNVMRIISRQFRIADDIGIAKNRKVFENKVLELMPDDPNRFNQALMELGALVCTPKNPKCEVCPVKLICQANQYNEQDKYPVKQKKQKQVEEHYKVLLIQRGTRIGMIKRENKGLLANLWGFPMLTEKQWTQSGLSEMEHIILEKTTHVFTHKKWHMLPVVIKWSKKLEKCLENILEKEDIVEQIQYFSEAETKQIPIASAYNKILKLIL